jgi:two-component system, LuxR family, response regulator FixJ
MTQQPTAYVIDDDDAVRDSILMVLETSGYTVRSFASGAALLRGDRPGKNDCLIIDMDMPGMGGLDLLDRLRCDGVITPAIVMTGGLSARRRAAVDRADAMFLEKPFGVGELVSCIERALGRSQT